MRFQVLGEVRVERAESPVVVKGPTQRRILAALLTRPGRLFPVTELVDALWSGDPPANAVKNVQSYVAKLKQVLRGPDPPVIRSRPRGYLLAVPPEAVDAHEFAQAVRRARDAWAAGDAATAGTLLERALRLWQGRPYADLGEWTFLQPEIERLQQTRLEAFALGLELGRHDRLLPDLAAIVEENPYQERPVALLMRALHVSGRQAEAQEVYRRTRERLSEELGIEPSTELRDLYQAMLRDDPGLFAVGAPIARGFTPDARMPAPLVSAGPVPAPPAAVTRAAPRNPESARRTAAPDSPVVLLDRMPWPPKGYQQRSRHFATLKAFGDESRSVAVCAVTGAPGVGKTQLAGAYARSRLAEGWNVVWIYAESRDDVVAGFVDLAEVFGLRDRDDDAEHAARRARRRLGELRMPGLLVFDNATDPTVIREWLPPAGTVQVVVTTNRKVFGWVGEQLDVEPFTPEQAHALLHEYTGAPVDEYTVRLAELLGHHPLALSIAAATIQRERLSFEEYLYRLHVLPLDDVLVPHEGDPYPRSMRDAILMSLHAVERDVPNARALAEVIAVLASSGVSRSLLVHDTMDSGRRIATSKRLGELLDASLLTYREDGRTVVMHALTRRIIRELAVRDARIAAALEEAVRLVGHRIRHASDGWDEATAYENLGHLEALFACAPEDHVSRETRLELTDLAVRTIRCFHENCVFLRVNDLNRATAAMQERLLGATDPATLESRRRQGREHRQNGRLDEAIGLLEQTLEAQERTLGPRHVDTLRTRYDVAGTYLTAGQADYARTLLLRLIADQQGVLRPDHPEVLVVRKRLALVERSLGALDRAARTYADVLPELARVLGRWHPQTLRGLSDAACLDRALGRVKRAIDVFTSIRAERAERLGAEHPDNRHERDRLAGALRSAGRHEEALALFGESRREWREALGERHPWTLMARNNLACAHHAAGDEDEATAELEAALQAFEQVLGFERPRTLNARNNLGCCYAAVGRLDDAREQLERALAGRERVLGSSHPDTRTSRHNLAVVLEQAGRPDLARPLWRRLARQPEPAGAEAVHARWWRNGFAYASAHSVDETIRLALPPGVPSRASWTSGAARAEPPGASLPWRSAEDADRPHQQEQEEPDRQGDQEP